MGDHEPVDIETKADTIGLEKQLLLVRRDRTRIEGIADYAKALKVLGWDIEGDDASDEAFIVDDLRMMLDNQIAELECDIQRDREGFDENNDTLL